MGNKIQRIYIGDQRVRPDYEFSYDFRSKSVATLTADGWLRPKGNSGVSFNSSGMYKSSNGYLQCIYPIDCAGANKITITANIISSSSDRDFAVGIERVTNADKPLVMWSTSYSDTLLRYWNNSGTSTKFYNGGTTTGTRTVNITIDISAKTIAFSDGQHSGTYNLTDGQVSDILLGKGLRCGVAKSNNYFQDVNIKINY